jgi:hypothetical protein
VALAIGAVMPSSHKPCKRYFARVSFVRGRDLIKRLQDRMPAGIEILGHGPTPSQSIKVGFGAVLARQEAGSQAEIGDYTEVLPDTEIPQRAFEGHVVVKVILGLEHLVPWQPIRVGDGQCILQLRRIVVRRADRLDLSGLKQVLVRRKCLLEGVSRSG